MGVYIDWELSGKYKNGHTLTDAIREELSDAFGSVADIDFGGDYFLSRFETVSINGFMDVSETIREFTEHYPDVILEAKYTYSGDECPDKIVAQDGKIKKYNGHVVYEEVFEE